MENRARPKDRNGDERGSRFLAFFKPGALPHAAEFMSKRFGVKMDLARHTNLKAEHPAPDLDGTIVLPTLGVIIFPSEPHRFEHLALRDDDPVTHIRQELIFSIPETDFNVPETPSEPAHPKARRPAVAAEHLDQLSFRDNDAFTWGLQSIGVSANTPTGNGVKLALLDTGIDFDHQDFRNRHITSQSFIAGVGTAKDDHGHGTHCAGTIIGPTAPAQGRRYGIAPGVELFVAKVLNNEGKGTESDILRGLDWAVQNGCRVVSMSFGKPVDRGAAPLPSYEQLGQTALQKNCLLVAAAGNDSKRPSDIEPVNLPANVPSIMAVGAVNRKMGIYENSNGGLNGNGGGVDLAGPGVDVYSSKRGSQYGFASGTSMATPHVAAVAALYMEADPSATAEQIWARLTQKAQRLPLPSTDVGTGLAKLL